MGYGLSASHVKWLMPKRTENRNVRQEESVTSANAMFYSNSVKNISVTTKQALANNKTSGLLETGIMLMKISA
jgi:hypothetical protein